jgi:diketogulonate reductase-like aldo/keto reductase
VDSIVLHGPASGYAWTADDAEAWTAMKLERAEGRARALGVSNVSLRHLEQMTMAHREAPAFVQNRCFAQFGWDREVRVFCRKHGIVYQGFSLLTANTEVLRYPRVHEIAAEKRATLAQVVFAFARRIGIVPLTGTSDAEHMKEDLESRRIELTEREVEEIEGLVG